MDNTTQSQEQYNRATRLDQALQSALSKVGLPSTPRTFMHAFRYGPNDSKQGYGCRDRITLPGPDVDATFHDTGRVTFNVSSYYRSLEDAECLARFLVAATQAGRVFSQAVLEA